MPTILRKTPKKQRILSKTDKYKARRKVYNSRQWRDGLRLVQLRKQPLCEVCLALGDITAGHDVHHRVSMNKAKTESDFYDLAYDEDNLATLCQYHHSLLHSKYKGKTVEELITILKDKPEENE